MLANVKQITISDNIGLTHVLPCKGRSGLPGNFCCLLGQGVDFQGNEFQNLEATEMGIWLSAISGSVVKHREWRREMEPWVQELVIVDAAARVCGEQFFSAGEC